MDKNYVKGKIIKLLLVLYINFEELNEKIKQRLSPDIREDYYFIKEEYIKKYMSNVEYDKIVDKLKNDKNIKKAYENNKQKIIGCMNENKDYDEYIFEIVKLFPEDMLKRLESKKAEHDDHLRESVYIRLNSEEISLDKINKKISYYNNNIIINDKLLNLFREIENNNLLYYLRYEKIQCLIGDNKIFIINNGNPLLLNIGHLNDEYVFETDLLICYYYENINFLNNFASDIKSKTFINYLKNLKLEYKEIINYDIFDDSENIIGEIIVKNNELIKLFPKEEIIKINEDSRNLIKLFIYTNSLINQLKSIYFKISKIYKIIFKKLKK